MDKPGDLSRGWEQVLSGHFRDSLISFSRVVHDFRWLGEARYGMAVAHLSLGEDVQAEAALWESLQQRMDNADALFYLGLVAERRGRRGEAAGRYREALALAPAHPHARVRLAALSTGASVRPQVVPLPQGPPTSPPVPVRQRLPRSSPGPEKADRSEIQGLLAAVEVSGRPRVIAFLGSLDREVLAPLPVNLATLAVLVTFGLALFLPRALLPPLSRVMLALQVAAAAGVALQLLVILLTVVRVTRMHARIWAGRVEVEGDMFRAGPVGIDLDRVTHLELRRSGLNWWTGDGTLAFTSPAGTILITGLARGQHLQQLYYGLLEVLDRLRGPGEHI